MLKQAALVRKPSRFWCCRPQPAATSEYPMLWVAIGAISANLPRPEVVPVERCGKDHNAGRDGQGKTHSPSPRPL